MDELNAFLQTTVNQAISITKWIFAVKMIGELLKNANKLDAYGAVQVLINGGISYASLYCVISILNGVESFFNK